jgi:EmrB/QacA subfamily drug resistance transporter
MMTISRARFHPSERYLFFGLAVLALLFSSSSSTVISVAIPSMVRDLNTSLAWIGWTLTGYSLVSTVMMPLSGKLAERFGRARVFLVSVGLFTLGSLLCGLAPNVYLLILSRVLQALGGGGLIPAGVGIVAEEFPENRERMLGLFTSVFPLATILGPNLAGLILEHGTWRNVFWINVPVGLLIGLALIPRALRTEKRASRKIDFGGAFLYAGALSAFLATLTLLGQDPGLWRTPAFWALLAVALALFAGFFFRERRAAEPILEPSLLARRPFAEINLYNLLVGAAGIAFFSFIPYFAVVRYGLGTLESAAVLTPRSIAMIAATILSSIYLRRTGYRVPMMAGNALTAATLLLLAFLGDRLEIGGLQLGPFWIMSAVLLLSGVGIGLFTPASNNVGLDLLPGRAAILSGLRLMFRSTGGTMGTALIVLGLEFSPDKAAGLRSIFVLIAAFMVLAIPLTLILPESRRNQRVVQPDLPAPRGELTPERTEAASR